MARQKKNRKAARVARKQARAERLAPQRQKRAIKAERRKAAREARKAARQKQRQQQKEVAKARKTSRALEKKDSVLYAREQKSATAFFGHVPNDRELNTWRGLVNSGAIGRIKELTFANYEPEAVKDAATDLLKTNMSSDEIVKALEGYIKDYAEKEQSLYDYVATKYGGIIPR